MCGQSEKSRKSFRGSKGVQASQPCHTVAVAVHRMLRCRTQGFCARRLGVGPSLFFKDPNFVS